MTKPLIGWLLYALAVVGSLVYLGAPLWAIAATLFMILPMFFRVRI